MFTWHSMMFIWPFPGPKPQNPKTPKPRVLLNQIWFIWGNWDLLWRVRFSLMQNDTNRCLRESILIVNIQGHAAQTNCTHYGWRSHPSLTQLEEESQDNEDKHDYVAIDARRSGRYHVVYLGNRLGHDSLILFEALLDVDDEPLFIYHMLLDRLRAFFDGRSCSRQLSNLLLRLHLYLVLEDWVYFGSPPIHISKLK